MSAAFKRPAQNTEDDAQLVAPKRQKRPATVLKMAAGDDDHDYHDCNLDRFLFPARVGERVKQIPLGDCKGLYGSIVNRQLAAQEVGEYHIRFDNGSEDHLERIDFKHLE